MIKILPFIFCALFFSTVFAGNPVSIHFEGNKRVSASSLRRVAIDELADFQKKGLRPADADDAAFQMEQAYRKKGYPFVEIRFRLEKRKEEGGKLVFIVQEGPRVSVRALKVSGNRGVGERTIRRVIGITKKGFFKREQPFVESRLTSALASLVDFYLYRGYMDIQIPKPEIEYSDDKKSVSIGVTVNEGSRYFLSGVEFEGEIPSMLVQSLAMMSRKLIGAPFQHRTPLLLKGQVQQLFGNMGFPDVKVFTSLRKIGKSGDVALEVKITPGPLVKVNSVRVKGNRKTREALILNRMSLKKGDIYSLKKKKDSFRDLYRTGFFKKISMEFDEGGRDFVVSVTEAMTKEFYFEAGWGSYERLRGKSGIKDKNIFGTGKIGSLETGVSFRSLSAEVSISDLWLFNSSMTGDFPVFYHKREEPSFTKVDTGFSVHVSLPLPDNVNYSAEYGFQETRLSDVSPQTLQENSQVAYQQGSLKLQRTYNSRDDVFIPTTGTKMTVTMEAAHPYLGSNLSFYRISWDSRFFWPLGQNSTVLAIRYATGLIVPGAREVNIPVGERFFNGGENTVRSFSEATLGPRDLENSPVGGFGFNLVNIELRQRLFGAFAGSLFFDAGNISPNISRGVRGKKAYSDRGELLEDTYEDFFRAFKTGVGIGIQYLLPIGPLRLDVAFNPSAEEQEDGYLVHFSVGTAF